MESSRHPYVDPSPRRRLVRPRHKMLAYGVSVPDRRAEPVGLPRDSPPSFHSPVGRPSFCRRPISLRTQAVAPEPGRRSLSAGGVRRARLTDPRSVSYLVAARADLDRRGVGWHTPGHASLLTSSPANRGIRGIGRCPRGQGVATFATRRERSATRRKRSVSSVPSSSHYPSTVRETGAGPVGRVQCRTAAGEFAAAATGADTRHGK